MPQPRSCRWQPLAEWPRIFRVDYGHEEAAKRFGDDPRVYAISGKRFIDNGNGHVSALETIEVQWVNGRPEEVPGTEKIWPADLVLLSMGFRPEASVGETLRVGFDARSNFAAEYGRYRTAHERVFAAATAVRAKASWCVQSMKGKSAREIDRFLMGESTLPRALRLCTPLGRRALGKHRPHPPNPRFSRALGLRLRQQAPEKRSPRKTRSHPRLRWRHLKAAGTFWRSIQSWARAPVLSTWSCST